MEHVNEQKEDKKFGWLKKLGFAGFLFFLIKGIGWLVLFGLVASGFMNQQTMDKIKDWLPF